MFFSGESKAQKSEQRTANEELMYDTLARTSLGSLHKNYLDITRLLDPSQVDLHPLQHLHRKKNPIYNLHS